MIAGLVRVRALADASTTFAAAPPDYSALAHSPIRSELYSRSFSTLFTARAVIMPSIPTLTVLTFPSLPFRKEPTRN